MGKIEDGQKNDGLESMQPEGATAAEQTPLAEDAALAAEAESVSGEVEDAPDAAQQIAELTDRLQRTLAEFDNYRKRTLKERASLHDDGLRYAIERILPVVDNFERAMQNTPQTEEPFFVGMLMILKQLTGTLTELGIAEIPALNESFNPEVHFAVSHIDDESYGNNEVIEVMQKGYKYKEKVIRPAMVRVAN